jgi:probable F420-dependent oxidoreductase
MDFGAHLPHLGFADRDALLRFARRIEDAGFHSGWVSDHIAWPSSIKSTYPYSDDGAFPAPNVIPWLDPIGTLTFVAAVTERLRLGTTVLILPYRPPVQTAKQLATLDVLSGGRLILGVGVGWMREEFDVLQMPFDHRGGRGDEQIEVFSTLFSDEAPSYEGRFYRFPAVGFEPKPVQQPVPIWVGGSSEAAFRRTARYGHAFHAAFESLAVIERSWARVRELASGEGRDLGELTLSVRWYLDPDQTRDPEKSVAGSPEQMVDTIGRLAEVGVSHLLLDAVAPGGVDGRLAAYETLASDVVPRLA